MQKPHKEVALEFGMMRTGTGMMRTDSPVDYQLVGIEPVVDVRLSACFDSARFLAPSLARVRPVFLRSRQLVVNAVWARTENSRGRAGKHTYSLTWRLCKVSGTGTGTGTGKAPVSAGAAACWGLKDFSSEMPAAGWSMLGLD